MIWGEFKKILDNYGVRDSDVVTNLDCQGLQEYPTPDEIVVSRDFKDGVGKFSVRVENNEDGYDIYTSLP